MLTYYYVVTFLALFVVALADEFIVDTVTGMMTIPKSCLHVCKQGACMFKNCQYPQCPGGACHFIDCKYPSCAGGGCTFERSIGATCHGGSCSFREPGDTLKAGYCEGGNCDFEGSPHPDFHSHLTI